MSNCQIRFKYKQQDIIIQCKRNEQIRDIIVRYGIKSGLSVNKLYFLYDGVKINPNLKLSQINDKDKEILFLVNQIENIENKNQIQKSDYVKCTQCCEPAIVDFSNDYRIILTDEKHGTKKLKLQDYNSTQMVDQNKIKCSKCYNSKAEAFQGEFYYCFECDKNFCPMCKSLLQKH